MRDILKYADWGNITFNLYFLKKKITWKYTPGYEKKMQNCECKKKKKCSDYSQWRREVWFFLVDEVMPLGDILFYFVSKTPANTDTVLCVSKRKKKSK